MSTAFGPAAVKLAGYAARLLGWRPAEFWAATPAELAAALGGWNEGSAEPGLDARAMRAMMEVLPDGR